MLFLCLGLLPLSLAFVSYRTNLEHNSSVEATFLTGRYETLNPYLAAEADFGDELTQIEDWAVHNGILKSQIKELYGAINGTMD